jgi:uncharacterized membrane protein YsdA (DUF1294 family)
MGDRTIECVECGRQFIWSHGEQLFYRERGLGAPKRCKACRARRRLEREPGMRRLWDPTVEPSGSPTAQRPASAGPSRYPRQRKESWRANAVYRHGLLALALAAVAAALVWWFGYPLNVAQSWCIAITVVTFLVYAYDKVAARVEMQRVPETVLLALTAAGGTIGALAGMVLFRHKTAKGSFQLKMLLVAVMQFVLFIAYLMITR